jgi:integrase
MRCEYSRVAIFNTRVPAKNTEPNYILLKAGNKANLVLKHFKTRKHHDPYDIVLPEPLVKDLKKSLETQPRDYLFVNSRNEPYTSHLYTKWTMRVFQSIFKRPMTVALIRHAFVNTIDFNKLSISDKREIATSMGHTVETQDRYRLLFDDTKSKCDCICTPNEKADDKK